MSNESQEENPFASPRKPVLQFPKKHRHIEPPSPQLVTRRMIELLTQTAPWVGIVGALGILAAIFSLLLGVVDTIASGTRGRPQVYPLFAFYIPLSFYQAAAAIYLCKYCRSIFKASRNPTADNVEAALDSQKSYWRLSNGRKLTSVIQDVAGRTV